jgi:RNA polymerase sigma factor (sigma-70 family)
MAKKSLNGALQHLRKLAAVQNHRELTDPELLVRFVNAHDEAAFTVLIERHGPMVLGVCGRLLPNLHDAEDACQATFLVLARKAASIRKQRSLSSWLHGVACRAAANLRRDHARRKSRERECLAPTTKDPAAEVSWREVQAILDEELQRLPERYRAPVILCYLECRTRDEAAKQLGLSLTTLHGRLERARDLLRACLNKRGLTLAATMCAAALGDGVAQGALTPTFVVSSTRAAMLLAAGQSLTEGIVAPHALALTREVLKSMFLAKLKLATVAVLSTGLFAALIGGSFSSLGIAQDARPRAVAEKKNGPPVTAESDAEFIRRVSRDLRATEPTPTEVHFFVTSKDAGRRQRLIDLFIQERHAKQAADKAILESQKVIEAEAQRREAEAQRLQNEKEPFVVSVRPGDGRKVELQKEKEENLDGAKPVEVRAHVSGYIVGVSCKPGEKVKKGDVLLRIDPLPYKAELEAAETAVDSSRLGLASAEATIKRLKSLAKSAVVSETEFAQAELQVAKAKAVLGLAQANRELAKLNLDAATVRAPIDGTIDRVDINAGNLAVADQMVLVTLIHPKRPAK